MKHLIPFNRRLVSFYTPRESLSNNLDIKIMTSHDHFVLHSRISAGAALVYTGSRPQEASDVEDTPKLAQSQLAFGSMPLASGMTLQRPCVHQATPVPCALVETSMSHENISVFSFDPTPAQLASADLLAAGP
jgi:hypothetical protein